MKVQALARYPLKGGKSVMCDRMRIERTGPSGDREWMLVDPNARFVSQRECPKLATLELTSEGGSVVVRFGDARQEGRVTAERIDATVWSDTVSVALAENRLNAFVSEHLQRDVRLVRFDERSSRAVDPDWAGLDERMALADGFPVLVTSTASLADLNASIRANGGDPVGMERFRPNIVLDGSEPWAEDRFGALQIGEVVLEPVKPCARCGVTTVDQEQGRRLATEPIETLRRIRRSADRRVPGVLFGVNAIVRRTGSLGVGDEVEILERRQAWPIHAA